MSAPMPGPADAPVEAIPGAPLISVDDDTDAELTALVAEYDRLDAEVKEKVERLESVKTRIKAELAARKPGESEVLLAAPSVLDKPLRMVWKISWRFDSKKLKAADPHTWVRYAKQGGAWYLERVK